MRAADVVRFSFRAFTGHRVRTLLLFIAMAIGVGSVIVLSTLGEGARSYVVGQFSSLGTNLLIILPGRSETVGGPPPLLGITPRDLTLEDAQALLRIRGIRYSAPIIVGAAPLSRNDREREVTVLGSTPHLYQIRKLKMAHGRFLPEDDALQQAAVCILGHKTKEELFGSDSALGQSIRIGEYRFRVIGVLAPMGESLGMDMSDVVIIPVASAQALFNTSSMFRIIVEAESREIMDRAKDGILRTIKIRHEGEDDVTVVSQDAVLATFDRIFTVLTLAVACIGAISIAVAGILIMNVMLIVVSQRRSEIGLLKALGATRQQILILFIAEAIIVSSIGSAFGVLVAQAGVFGIEKLFPVLPLQIPLWSLAVAVTIALLVGVIFAVLPALNAAKLDPVVALSRR